MTTTTYNTSPRPKYDGPRTKWTQADGTYSIHVCVPTAGRTFLFDDSNDGPSAEFERITGAKASGMVGSAGGQSAFLLHAQFPAANDAEAMAHGQRIMDAYGDAIGVRVFYIVPNEHGSGSDLVGDLGDL